MLANSPDCLTGTDRVAEVARKIKARQYINLQGDEPIFPIEEIRNFIDSCKQNTDVVHTAIIPIKMKKTTSINQSQNGFYK